MHRARVLLVDDRPEIIDSATALLEQEFEIVGRAHTGEQGLKSAAELGPDLIVLDISMPDINGFEVANRLRQLNAGCRIVMLTVHEDLDLMRAAQKLGVMGYVLADMPETLR